MYSHKGRSAASNRASRCAETTIEREPADDQDLPHHVHNDATRPAPATECLPETVKTIISRNQSPDIHFSQSINPYRGCEHGCVYCYARREPSTGNCALFRAPATTGDEFDLFQ